MTKTSHGYHRSTQELPTFDNLIFEEEDGVATITLNRPNSVNALS